MGLGTVSVCLTVLVLNLHHRDAECPVPRWTRVLVLHHLAWLLRVRARKPKTMAGNLLLDSPEDMSIDLKGGLRRIARGIGLLRPVPKMNGYADKYRDHSVDGGEYRRGGARKRRSRVRKGDHT